MLFPKSSDGLQPTSDLLSFFADSSSSPPPVPQNCGDPRGVAVTLPLKPALQVQPVGRSVPLDEAIDLWIQVTRKWMTVT